MSARATPLIRAGCSALMVLGLLTPARSVFAIDVFGTNRYVPPDPTAGIIGGTICTFGALSAPLPLPEAIERALCENPKTRQAWTGVKQAAAALGQAKAAYLPTFSATWQGVRDDSGRAQPSGSEYARSGVCSVRFRYIQLGSVRFRRPKECSGERQRAVDRCPGNPNGDAPVRVH